MAEQLVRLIEQYLAGDIVLADFSLRFGVMYARTREDRSDASANRLCSMIIGHFAEFSRGDLSEASFKEELAKSAAPSAERASAE